MVAASKNSDVIAVPKKGMASSGEGRAVNPQIRVSKSDGEAMAVVHRSIAVELAESPRSRALMIRRIQQGLRFSVLERLGIAIGASAKEIGRLISIPPSTMTRRKKEGRLNAEESDRVMRLARLKDAAMELMDGDDAASVQWLNTPLEILGDESPLEHANTELGARDVEDLISCLRHGVFS